MLNDSAEVESCQMQGISIDQEFKDLIPGLTGDEYSRLEESIVSEGCRDALVVWNGLIVDGHNRYAICTEHDIPFRIEKMEFESRDQVKTWIIQNQIGRRNLEPGQRGMLVLRLENLVKGLAENAKNNQRLSDGRGNKKGWINWPNLFERANTRKSLADIAGIGERTMARVKKINAEGSEELKDSLTKGKISVNKAYKEIRANENKDKGFRSTKDFLPAQTQGDFLDEEDDGLPDKRLPIAKLVGISKSDVASLDSAKYDPVAAYKAAHEEYIDVILSEKMIGFKHIAKEMIVRDIEIMKDLTIIS